MPFPLTRKRLGACGRLPARIDSKPDVPLWQGYAILTLAAPYLLSSLAAGVVVRAMAAGGFTLLPLVACTPPILLFFAVLIPYLCFRSLENTLSFSGLEIHLRKQFQWRGRPLHLTHPEFLTITSQFRRKMGPGNPIRTVPHSGYKFEPPPEQK